MPKLVIVESPAKAKTIGKYLGRGYKVTASMGHVRDLPASTLGIDVENGYTPKYITIKGKQKLVKELKAEAKKCDGVLLATDPDREGEAISWHLANILGLDPAAPNRVTFDEITKKGVKEGMAHPRAIDIDLFNAQQARRELDRLVGYKLSPFLWRKVRKGLSAGRVQSVAVKLIVEREREIQKFQSEPFFRVNAIFDVAGGSQVKAELDHRFKTYDEAHAFLESCKDAAFTVGDITKKPLKRMPAPPFTTSTLQQEAARKLGFTVSQTMMIAQRLYESGRITYMRTDSVHLSSFALNACKDEIMKDYGEEYIHNREFQTKSKGAQEAHEAIRPTFANTDKGEWTSQERRLYDLIWKRTIASQMAEAKIEKTTAVVNMDNRTEHFVANGEVVVFDGFLKVYRESTDDDALEPKPEGTNILPALAVGESLSRKNVTVTERFTLAPARYTEASLVHKLEELGIGRPSTYAPTISTIQQREYVVKGDKPGKERPYTIDTLEGDTIKQETKVEFAGSERGKLIPTDIGTVVNDFLQANFPEIMDYNFTAKVEGDFDRIAEGKEDWKDMLHKFDDHFEPQVENVINQRSEHKAGERQIGVEPKSGKPVFVKIGRFGPVVQIGAAGGDEKPQFAQMPKDKSIETITLDEALELFKLPRKVGKYEGTDVTIGAGRFGPYVLHDKKYVSIPKGEDPMTITLERSIELIEAKRKAEKERHIKTFAEDAKMELLKGRFGPYIAYDGKNYHIDKKLHERALAGDLTYDECMDIVKNAPEPKPRRGRKS